VQILDMFVMEPLGLAWAGQHIRGVGQTLGPQTHSAGTGMTVVSGRKPGAPVVDNRRRSLLPVSARELADKWSEG
jgi:hypothetical protein